MPEAASLSPFVEIGGKVECPITDIQPPDLETRIAILRTRARWRCTSAASSLTAPSRRSARKFGGWDHVRAAGNGKTILFVQKARQDSERHGKTLVLAWADDKSGGFILEEKVEVDDETILRELLEVVGTNSGIGWTTAREKLPGRKQKRDEILARALADRLVVNVTRVDGVDRVVSEIENGKRSRLYCRSDPAVEHLIGQPARHRGRCVTPEPLMRAVAELLGYSPATIVDWAEAGTIPSFKVGGRLRFRQRWRRGSSRGAAVQPWCHP